MSKRWQRNLPPVGSVLAWVGGLPLDDEDYDPDLEPGHKRANLWLLSVVIDEAASGAHGLAESYEAELRGRVTLSDAQRILREWGYTEPGQVYAAAGLNEKEQWALELKEVRKASEQEIARLAGEKLSTVSMRLWRARKKLDKWWHIISQVGEDPLETDDDGRFYATAS